MGEFAVIVEATLTHSLSSDLFSGAQSLRSMEHSAATVPVNVFVDVASCELAGSGSNT